MANVETKVLTLYPPNTIGGIDLTNSPSFTFEIDAEILKYDILSIAGSFYFTINSYGQVHNGRESLNFTLLLNDTQIATYSQSIPRLTSTSCRINITNFLLKTNSFTILEGQTNIFKLIVTCTLSSHHRNIYAWHNNNRVSSLTLSYAVPLSNTISYHNGTEWVECEVYYHDGTNWVLVDPYYHNGSEWVLCNSSG